MVIRAVLLSLWAAASAFAQLEGVIDLHVHSAPDSGLHRLEDSSDKLPATKTLKPDMSPDGIAFAHVSLALASISAQRSMSRSNGSASSSSMPPEIILS